MDIVRNHILYVINEPMNKKNVKNVLLIDMCVSMSRHRFDPNKNGSGNYWYLEWTNKKSSSFNGANTIHILWQPSIWNVNDLATILRSMTSEVESFKICRADQSLIWCFTLWSADKINDCHKESLLFFFSRCSSFFVKQNIRKSIFYSKMEIWVLFRLTLKR